MTANCRSVAVTRATTRAGPSPSNSRPPGHHQTPERGIPGRENRLHYPGGQTGTGGTGGRDDLVGVAAQRRFHPRQRPAHRRYRAGGARRRRDPVHRQIHGRTAQGHEQPIVFPRFCPINDTDRPWNWCAKRMRPPGAAPIVCAALRTSSA
jgi:hypothetical protein